jgi:tetratricopeptide (TPR) repeat protein
LKIFADDQAAENRFEEAALLKRLLVHVAFAGITVGGLLFSLPGLLAAQTAPQGAPAPQAQQGQTAPPAEEGPPRKQRGSSAAPAQNEGQSAAAPTEKKPPSAKSQEELDAYQKFMREQNPDEQVRLIEDFLLQYPNTELKEYAYQSATQAYQAKNDFAKVMTYGELTLAENPNNLVALLILASSIPERTAKSDLDKEAKLAQAEQYANRGLEVLSKLTMPSNLTEQQWTQIKRDAESTPHAALGVVALIREDFPKAESEFKTAIEMASKPDPVTLYRLGLCYSFEKKYDPALEALDRAASSGGVKIPGANGATRDLVAEAKDFVVKAKAASETPVSGAAAPSAPAPGGARP